ncbi:G-protein coupled receptor family C group 6 member A-like isoform X2 [Ambystoma mexicanum]|uniref:G-protein coupled receptor family C group 6 member A-like isoform X2 n=1 Tax=Ambystoma mexicanum TaxID=8296 RepID=UPI0037E80056
MISHSSSASILSDKKRFLSFLRAVPSDVYQTKAMAKLIRAFQWNWVGVIASDDDYGRSALQSLSDDIGAESICIAYKKLIHFDVNHPDLKENIQNITDTLVSSNASVVVILAKSSVVIKLIGEFVKLNITKTWIASDAWSTSKEVATMEGASEIGTVLGFSFKSGKIDGFEEYLQNLYPQPLVINRFIEEYKDYRFLCTEEYKQCLETSSKACNASDSVNQKSPMACSIDNVLLANDDFLVQNVEQGTAYGVYLAVTAIAQGLRSLMCDSGRCNNITSYPPGQLLNKIKKVNFSLDDGPFYFDENGDSINGYDLMNWQYRNGSFQLRKVGEFTLLDQNVKFNKIPIQWNSAEKNIPFSNCSKPCPPGQYKEHSLTSCCYACVPCAEGYYSKGYDLNKCSKCLDVEWSNNGSSSCNNKTTDFLHWGNPFSIVLLCFCVFGFVTVLVIEAIFLKYWSTPAVKAAGGTWSCVMAVSLLASFVSPAFFIGEPTDTTCQIRQTMYGISFTLCVSCVLLKSLRIVLAFKLGKIYQPKRKVTHLPAVVIITATAIQILICTMWLIFNPPERNTIYSDPQTILLQCAEGSYVAFGIMLGYIGVLALLCFVVAFKGRRLPGKYKEARFITFSMLIYMFVWIAFIPIYISTAGVYLPAVQVVAILASNYGIITCHLLPPCYVIVFKKTVNNRASYLHSIRIFHRAKQSIFPRTTWAAEPENHSLPPRPCQTIRQPKTVCVSVIPITRRRRKSC